MLNLFMILLTFSTNCKLRFCRRQCDHIWHFGMMLKNFGHIERVHLVFGNILNLLWLILYVLLQHIHCCKWPKIEQTIHQSGHTRCRPCHNNIK